MKIAIYTTSKHSFLDRYNISKLVDAFPNAQFYFIEIATSTIKKSISDKIKQKLIRIKNGKNWLQHDNQVIAKNIATKIIPFNKSMYPTYSVEKVNDEMSIKILSEIKPDILLQSRAGILKDCIFSIPKIGTLNVHHGFAPEIRGMNSTFWCLYYGLTDHIGVTCHFIDEHLDTGTVIKQYKYPYQNGDSFIKIQSTLFEKGGDILVDSVQQLLQNAKPAISPSEVKSYYFSSIDYRVYNLLRKNKFLALELKEPHSKLKTKQVIKF